MIFTWQNLLWIVLLEVASVPVLALLFGWLMSMWFVMKKRYIDQMIVNFGGALSAYGEMIKKKEVNKNEQVPEGQQVVRE